MAASLYSSPPLLVAAAAIGPSDDLLTTLFLLALLPLLAVVIWFGTSSRSRASSRAEPVARGASLPVQRPRVARRLPSVQPRVISLYSTTPGQSPHEYNIGDHQGTRGSALARAA